MYFFLLFGISYFPGGDKRTDARVSMIPVHFVSNFFSVYALFHHHVMSTARSIEFISSFAWFSVLLASISVIGCFIFSLCQDGGRKWFDEND